MSPPPVRVIVRSEAEADITDAAIWYHKKQPGRRVLTDRFPYRVFFIRRDDAVIVFRVLHGARHDREWKSSIPKA